MTEEFKKDLPEVEKSAFEEEIVEESKVVTAEEITTKEVDRNKTEQGRKYFVYANLNIPREEDFTFLVTALWHWYDKYSHPSLQLIKDPAEIVQDPPSTAL